MRALIKRVAGTRGRALYQRLRALNPLQMRADIDALYGLLYDMAHDVDNPLPIASLQTERAFAHQWSAYETGRALLSDPAFKADVTRILTEEELQIRPEWFKGKRVLDAGCGNGRWSYGLAKLGAKLTCVDINPVAIEKTRAALLELGAEADLRVCALENLGAQFAPGSFDLVFCWGVAHHAHSFTRALDALTQLVAPEGVLYLYLYGRETHSRESDLALFKERVRFNTLETDEERRAFLLQKAGGDAAQVHNQHDVYAPLVNRRFSFAPLKEQLLAAGFADVTRTIAHTELFVRALRGNVDDMRARFLLPQKQPRYWFE